MISRDFLIEEFEAIKIQIETQNFFFKRNKSPNLHLISKSPQMNIKEYISTQLNEEQTKAALHIDTSALIIAGAGS